MTHPRQPLRCLNFAVLAILVAIANACCHSTQPKRAPNFRASLTTVLVYAQEELGYNFATDRCERCEVRVIKPRSIQKFVDLDKTGFSDVLRGRVAKTISANETRAVVISGLTDPRNQSNQINIVYLPMRISAFAGLPESEGVLLTSGFTIFGCEIGQFGKKPGREPACAGCALGICCRGKCPSCQDCLPLEPIGPLGILLNGPADLNAYVLDENLLSQSRR